MKFQPTSLTAILALLTTVSAIAPTLAKTPTPTPPPPSGNGYELCQSRTQAMLPAIEIADQVLVNQLVYPSQLPKRGDIIVFKPNARMLQQYFVSDLAYPADLNGVYVIRRVIGLPGETVSIIGGTVYINNQPLAEKYIKQKPNYLVRPTIVPDNSYFVLGDNRNNSSDSHSWGFVSQDLIVGQFAEIVGKPAQHSKQEKQLESPEQQPQEAPSDQLSLSNICFVY